MLALRSKLCKLTLSFEFANKNLFQFSTQPKLNEIQTKSEDLDTMIDKRNDEILNSMKSQGLPEFLTPHQTWVYTMESNTKMNKIMVLDPIVFNFNPRIDILNDVVRWEKECLRPGNESQKSRAEKRGSGRKPWPQKGTGRARQGSVRAPHFMGGGKAHAIKPSDHSYNLPKRLQCHGVSTLFTLRHLQGDMIVVDRLLPEPDPENKADIPVRSEYLFNLLERYNCNSIYFVDDYADPKFDFLMDKSQRRSQEEGKFFSYQVSSHSQRAFDLIRCDKLVITVAALRLFERRIATKLR
ncbi:39S ribosomal protein L4, mitochondrial-like [Oopsacas minuta]|uniref:Large ribosomal subunit protein uL4m n=1 Tax=Oopsacas minuta TaxID=111878 RepID=A0AAV7JV98_9METZ|nr:39S ribosomal protein L4, mitochondrial-like [Oopsacas minuta]